MFHPSPFYPKASVLDDALGLFVCVCVTARRRETKKIKLTVTFRQQVWIKTLVHVLGVA